MSEPLYMMFRGIFSLYTKEQVLDEAQQLNRKIITIDDLASGPGRVGENDRTLLVMECKPIAIHKVEKEVVTKVEQWEFPEEKPIATGGWRKATIADVGKQGAPFGDCDHIHVAQGGPSHYGTQKIVGYSNDGNGKLLFALNKGGGSLDLDSTVYVYDPAFNA